MSRFYRLLSSRERLVVALPSLLRSRGADAFMKSNLERSLRAKSGGGVKTCGAPGGQPGRHGCDREEYHRHRGKGCWVGGFDAHEHGGHSACESEGRDQAGCETDGSETQTLTHDKLENVSGLSTQGHSTPISAVRCLTTVASTP